MNVPPFTISASAADSLAKVVEMVVRLELSTDFKNDLRLHRANRMKTIYSSLAIEGNPLDLPSVTAVINGKRVVGPQESMREVIQAHKAYELLPSYSPYSVADFLKAHGILTNGLIEESGMFRLRDVGVFDGNKPIHFGARPQFVPNLIGELFGWAQESTLHPVIKSAIVHYEIEIIHPFADGNGRMGRLWQSCILAAWNPVFVWIPMESVVYERLGEYYQAIEKASAMNDSGPFIDFALSALLASITEQMNIQEGQTISLSENQKVLLKALQRGALSRKELFEALKMTNDTRSYKRLFEPLLELGYIELTIPDAKTSPNQRYQLTDRGRGRL